MRAATADRSNSRIACSRDIATMSPVHLWWDPLRESTISSRPLQHSLGRSRPDESRAAPSTWRCSPHQDCYGLRFQDRRLLFPVPRAYPKWLKIAGPPLQRLGLTDVWAGPEGWEIPTPS